MPDHPLFHKMLLVSLADIPRTNHALDLKLFAMVNNDAWLRNSSLEGGQMAAAASLLSAVIETLIIQDPHTATSPTNALRTLLGMLQQINANDTAIQQITAKGQTLELISSQKPATWTTGNYNMRARHPTPLKEVKEESTDESRERLIQPLAADFAEAISKLAAGQSVLIPGGFFAHAMLFEFKRTDNDSLVLKIYNTGNGLSYHEAKTQIDQGIVKEKYHPILAYQLPFKEVSSSEFTSYLTELLKTKIASAWIPLPSETIPLAYPRTARDLYQTVLPLVVHIGGQLIDPKPVCPQLKFITGQRSGKCSEAVFHPLLREVFADEAVYQRFMLAYRKATIANFMASADFTNPMAIRHLNLAVTHLAARAYKHSLFLASDELAAITSFTREVLADIHARSVQMSGSPTLPSRDPSTERESSLWPINPAQLILKDLESTALTSITLTASGAEPIVAYEPMAACRSDATAVKSLDALLKQMDELQGWLKNAQQRPGISPKEIVVAIENFFFTYPMNLLHETLDTTQHQQLTASIQTLMILYWQSTFQQLGGDAATDSTSRLLTARQVITVYAALALITVENNTPLFTAAMQAIFVQSVSESLNINTHDPFLTSGNLVCDQRLAALSSLSITFTKDLLNKKTQEIYAATISANEAQKNHLLETFRMKILPALQTFNLKSSNVTFLNTEGHQCLFVLLNAYDQLSPENQLLLTLSRDTFARLVHCHQLFNLFGDMVVDPSKCPKEIESSFDKLKLMSKIKLEHEEQRDGSILWQLTTPFNVIDHISGQLKKAHPPPSECTTDSIFRQRSES